MNKVSRLGSVWLLLWLTGSLLAGVGYAQQGAVSRLLERIPGAKVRQIRADTLFLKAWEVLLPQPVDHDHPGRGSFLQRLWVSYRDDRAPVVFVTEGYSAPANYVSELARITGANQIIVEHRYFGRSLPDTLDWHYLTIRQAAADHHRIYQLFHSVWKGKWISTGISKGGQTTMYYRYFYPEDADICVPYVGPLNHAAVDPRIFTFLDTVGSPECRKKIRTFQMEVLKRRKELFPFFQAWSKEKGYTWRRAGGDSAAYEYAVMEYPFSFWQWGMDCGKIPEKGQPAPTLFEYLAGTGTLEYFSDEGIRRYEAFYYQALSELGYYGYRSSLYAGEIRNVEDTTFLFAVPRGSHPHYDPAVMDRVEAFLQNRGDHFIYIYGGQDTWSATAVRLHGPARALEVFSPGGCHATRIRTLPPAMQQQVLDTLEQWLDFPLFTRWMKK